MASLFRSAVRICPKAIAPSRTLARSSLLVAQPSRFFSQSIQRLEKRYTETHEWIDVSADGKTCKIGITTHAAEALGDIVFVEVPEVGEEVAQGDAFGSVESVKSASDLVSPISGNVIATNGPIVDKPADLSADPEGEGWLIEVEATDVESVKELMDAETYAEFAANDHH
ncbi:glycine cleavage H-protein-domain-containing protein [Stachybotrys elegans]|uniref:Glycine cleavage system H protein n=1 Tax=Stachybotrys elegans TaxID=80388 RepID=A0A8K0SPS4_9HYPO|nr:glycine cleavage H-protein-domain-containing protein [Stachybotrys elegans]